MADNLITMGVGNWGDEEEEDEEAVAARMAVVSEFLLCASFIAHRPLPRPDLFDNRAVAVVGFALALCGLVVPIVCLLQRRTVTRSLKLTPLRDLTSNHHSVYVHTQRATAPALSRCLLGTIALTHTSVPRGRSLSPTYHLMLTKRPSQASLLDARCANTQWRLQDSCGTTLVGRLLQTLTHVACAHHALPGSPCSPGGR